MGCPADNPLLTSCRDFLFRRNVDDHNFIREDGAKFELSAKGGDIPLQRGHIEIGFAFEPRDVGMGDLSRLRNLYLGFLTGLA